MNSNNNDKSLSAFIMFLRIFIFLAIAIPAGYFSVILGILSLSTTFITAISIVYILLLVLLWISLFYRGISTEKKVVLWLFYIGLLVFATLIF